MIHIQSGALFGWFVFIFKWTLPGPYGPEMKSRHEPIWRPLHQNVSIRVVSLAGTPHFTVRVVLQGGASYQL